MLGDVLAYFGTVEAQERQALHIHFLVWVTQLIIGELQHFLADRARCAHLFRYIDRVVTQSLPSYYKNGSTRVAPKPAPEPATWIRVHNSKYRTAYAAARGEGFAPADAMRRAAAAVGDPIRPPATP